MTSPATAGESATPEATEPQVFVMAWDKATTPLEAVERALYALADRLTGVVVDTGDSWQLTAHPRSSADEEPLIAHRLRREVNDQALRVRISERTDPIRNLIFALAFSRSGLADAQQATSPGKLGQ